MNREFDCGLKFFGRFVLATAFLLMCLPYPAHTSARATLGTTLIQKPNEKKAATTIPAGEAFTLHSNILGEDRTVFVAVPASYSRSVQAYPVLYLTDAQWQFAHTRTTAAFLARNGIIPEMIIIGVTNPDRTHDLYATRADFKQNGRIISFPTSGNADRFLEFFEKELISWTEANYRTIPLRILAGHSAGGNFALHVIRMKPVLFQAIIAASPWLAWDDHKELNALVSFLASANVPLRTLFFTFADEGAEMRAERNCQNQEHCRYRYKMESHATSLVVL